VYELYPFPGLVDGAGSDLEIELKPFELRCLQLVVAGRLPAGTATQDRPTTRATRSIDLSGLSREVHDEADGACIHVARGAIVLPRVERHDHLVLVARFHRDGTWWYHPDPRTLIELSARLKGTDVYYEIVPTVRARTGLGSPWILFAIPAGPTWTGEQLDLSIRARLPAGVSPVLESHLYDPWSRRLERRFVPLPTESTLLAGELLGMQSR
jgi:hypothetical protein